MPEKSLFFFIEDMTREFLKLKPEDLQDDALYRHWQLRVSLALTQQLCVTSYHLQKLVEQQDQKS